MAHLTDVGRDAKNEVEHRSDGITDPSAKLNYRVYQFKFLSRELRVSIISSA